MADSKATTTKTIGGGTLTTTFTPKTSYRGTNSETVNLYGFAAIKTDGSVVAWGQNSNVPSSLNGTLDAVQIYSNSSNFVALRNDGSVPCWRVTLNCSGVSRRCHSVAVRCTRVWLRLMTTCDGNPQADFSPGGHGAWASL